MVVDEAAELIAAELNRLCDLEEQALRKYYAAVHFLKRAKVGERNSLLYEASCRAGELVAIQNQIKYIIDRLPPQYQPQGGATV